MSLVSLFFCTVMLVIVAVVALVATISRGRTARVAGPAPASAPRGGLSLESCVAFDRLVARWAAEGRLGREAAAAVRELLAAHVAELMAPPAPAPVAAPAAAPAPPPAVAAAGPGAAQHAGAPPAGPAAAPPAPRPSPLRALGAAVLALDTRRVLLFLGTFLLIMSSLTLVVFNWSSLPALVQLAILAGTAGAIWAGGAWMARKPDLATAGRNLQVVAALLMPVVGFALGRPGLLDLGPRPAWLLASCVSLAAYLAAAWRTRRAFYSGAAAAAALSALLAALSVGEAAAGWQPAPALLLLAALLPAARALRAGPAPQLAAGPRWVALVGGPAVGLAAGALALGGAATAYASAATLAAGALFCGLAYRAEGRRPWLWAALGLAPAAAQLALFAAGAALEGRALALGLCALAYVLLGEPASARHRPAAAPLLVGGLAMGAAALLITLIDDSVAVLALPPLVTLGAALFALVETGRLRWAARGRVALAAGGLGAAGLLLFAWLGALLGRAPIDDATAALILLPLAGAAFAGARWWPGRRRRAYDLALQGVGSLIALWAGGTALLWVDTRLPGALLLAVILGGQAAARRAWPWAALSLGSGLAAVAFAVGRLAPAGAQTDVATLAMLGACAAYTIAAAMLRRTALRYWTGPGMAWGTFAGLIAFYLVGPQIVPATPLAVGVVLGGAALFGAHTALWRREEPGYGAAPFLALGLFLAATRGLFTGWEPAPGDMAYALCAIVVALAMVGQALRPHGSPFALPYELFAFILLPAAPLLAAGRPGHLALTWAAMAALYGLALWRYRVPWMLAPAFISADMALLHGAGWLAPGGEPARAGLLIAAAVWAQALACAWLRRRPAPWGPAGQWGYASAAIGGLGALALTLGSSGYGAAVALALAALLAALAWIEGREEAAWASLGLLGLALGLGHHALGLDAAGSLLLGSLEALAIYAAGWVVAALAGARPRLAPWRRPLGYGAAAAAVALPAILAPYSLGADPLLLGPALLLLGLALGVVGWRQRLQALAAPALVAWSLALAADGALRSPEAWAALGAYLLLGLAWAEGLAAVWAGRRRGPALARPIYAASLAPGALALLLAWGASAELAVVAGGLAALWALAASVERAEAPAWGALALLVAALAWAGDALGLAPAWAAAWLVLALAGVCVAGWAAAAAGLALWRRPTTHGALGAALVATALAPLLGGALPPLTFALASLGLLLATLAVRERELYYAYAAGAAFVGAALTQLADWGVAELQWYVLPAGLYLLALAAGLRRFQGRRRASQVVETAAAMLILGVSFAQAIRPEGGLPYSLLLFGESLAVAAYGALGRLRVPFLGGVAFFVAGVTWMTLDSVRLVNQWVLLGAVGLLMVAAYVVLERHQERLLRAGRHWAAELRSWA